LENEASQHSELVPFVESLHYSARGLVR